MTSWLKRIETNPGIRVRKCEACGEDIIEDRSGRVYETYDAIEYSAKQAAAAIKAGEMPMGIHEIAHGLIIFETAFTAKSVDPDGRYLLPHDCARTGRLRASTVCKSHTPATIQPALELA